jgi:hypothetical protein
LLMGQIVYTNYFVNNLVAFTYYNVWASFTDYLDDIYNLVLLKKQA